VLLLVPLINLTKILFTDGTDVIDTGTVSLTGVQTLTNKTLTAPILDEINDSKVMKKLYLQLLLLQLMKLQSLMLQLVIDLTYR
jgi:hypothetical protein